MSSIARAVKKEILKDNKRREIVDSAARFFVLKGYDRTTMDDIARDCDISKGMIYNYFRSKDDILNVIAQCQLDSHTVVTGRIEELSQEIPGDDVISRIETIIEAFCRHHSYKPRFTFVMHDERNRIDRDKQRRFMELGQRCAAGIQKLVEKGVAAGILDTRQPRLAAVTIVFAAQEWVYRWILLRDYYTFEEFLEFHKENMLRMLGVKPDVIEARKAAVRRSELQPA